MGETQAPSGPDLGAGVSLSSLEEGRPVAGHVGGDAVLLARSGSEIFAVDAFCTHYGGPLADGLVTGDGIRCPWHHACFSLRTGEALAAPAFRPLGRWRTELSNGVVRVTGRASGDVPRRSVRAPETPRSIVIIGAGAAGSAAAEMLRREGYAGPVTLVDPDPAAPYDRPNLSKDYLAGSAPEDWLPLWPPEFFAEQRIERVVAAATAIDVADRAVVLADGGRLEYGALLLATGAAPIRPRLPGADRPHVHVLRTLEDCRALIRDATSARQVLIAGASFIGMEAAASLRARGLDVTVVAPEAVPFERTLGVELGRMLQSIHEDAGVRFRLGRMLQSIGEGDVVLDDGSSLPADLVLLGLGVRPMLELAATAGVADERGVPVDEFMETRVRGIFAAGDIAQLPAAPGGERVRVEHWVAAQRQGQAAARNLLGAREPFVAVPFFWTRQHDVAVNYTGHAAAWDEARVDGDPAAHDCRVSYLQGGVVRAVATVNRDRESLAAERSLSAAAGVQAGSAPCA